MKAYYIEESKGFFLKLVRPLTITFEDGSTEKVPHTLSNSYGFFTKRKPVKATKEEMVLTKVTFLNKETGQKISLEEFEKKKADFLEERNAIEEIDINYWTAKFFDSYQRDNISERKEFDVEIEFYYLPEIIPGIEPYRMFSSEIGTISDETNLVKLNQNWLQFAIEYCKEKNINYLLLKSHESGVHDTLTFSHSGEDLFEFAKIGDKYLKTIFPNIPKIKKYEIATTSFEKAKSILAKRGEEIKLFLNQVYLYINKNHFSKSDVLLGLTIGINLLKEVKTTKSNEEDIRRIIRHFNELHKKTLL